jgi:predicted peroxiredoxin
VTVLENGCTRKKVLAGFLNSDEMKQLCDSLGIEAGSYHSDEIVDQNTKVTYFVSRMYRYCLGRKADASGLASWVSALIEGRATGTKIATGFFFSPEMKQMGLDNQAFVTNAYVALLDRQPDDKGLNTWVNALNSNGDRNKIVNGFVKSEEFANLCAEYGILR